MKKIGNFTLTLILILGIYACDSGLSCVDGSDAITTATQDYEDAIDSGSDASTECLALKAALETLINESDCPQETITMTQNLLEVLNCD